MQLFGGIDVPQRCCPLTICDTTNRMIAESRQPFIEWQLSNSMNRRTQVHSIRGSSGRHGLSAGSACGNWAVFWSPGRGRLRPRIQKHSGTSDHSERFPVSGGSSARLVGQLDTSRQGEGLRPAPIPTSQSPDKTVAGRPLSLSASVSH